MDISKNIAIGCHQTIQITIALNCSTVMKIIQMCHTVYGPCMHATVWPLSFTSYKHTIHVFMCSFTEKSSNCPCKDYRPSKDYRSSKDYRLTLP